jgi:hypothetical protein
MLRVFLTPTRGRVNMPIIDLNVTLVMLGSYVYSTSARLEWDLTKAEVFNAVPPTSGPLGEFVNPQPHH